MGACNFFADFNFKKGLEASAYQNFYAGKSFAWRRVSLNSLQAPPAPNLA